MTETNQWIIGIVVVAVILTVCLLWPIQVFLGLGVLSVTCLILGYR